MSNFANRIMFSSEDENRRVSILVYEGLEYRMCLHKLIALELEKNPRRLSRTFE